MSPTAHSVRWDPLRQQWARVPYFLIRQKIGERIDQRRSPLGNPRRQGQTERNRALDCRFGVRTPCYQLALRRSRSLRRFVPPLGGTSQGATEKAPCRSRPKRGGCCPIAAHEVKRRPRVFVRALDGAGGIATRAGSQRAEPFGVSFVQPFLHEQKRAGRRRHNRRRRLPSKTKHPDKLQLSPQNRRQLRFHAAASYIFYLAAVTRYTAACPPSHRPGDRSAAPAC